MKRPAFRKIVFALAPVTALLLLVEGGLRIGGYRSRTADPFESFVLERPLFEPDGGDLVTSPARTGFFHPQRFPRVKPDGEVRFFVFGGSTVGGANVPDSAVSCFGARLAEMLRQGRPAQSFRQVNCGGKAYAVRRLVNLVRECLDYSPDFFVVLSGHNEFLEARHYAEFREEPGAMSRVWHDLRIVQLAAELGARLRSRDAPAGAGPDDLVSTLEIDPRYVVRSPDDFERTRREYEEDLRKIVALCAGRGVPMIVCTVPSNLRNAPPFAMEPRSVLSREELCARLDELIAMHASGRHEDALAGARQVLLREERAAPFHYLAAKCLDGLGRIPEARRCYLLAKDTDAFPHRAQTSFNETVRRVAAETPAELFDAEALLGRLALDGIPGKDLFVDHCHPNREAHLRLAEGLREVVRELGW